MRAMALKNESFHRKTSNYHPWLLSRETLPIFHEGGGLMGTPTSVDPYKNVKATKPGFN